MLRSRSILARPLFCSRLGLALAGCAGAAALSFMSQSALAQSSVCQEIATHLTERKSLVDAVQKLGGKDKKMEPKAACAALGKLAANGATTLKWAETNKDWCQIPPTFIEGIKSDHEKVVKIRGQACNAAKRGAPGGQDGGGGLLGGGGLEGTYKIPQGAL